jgi:prepilin-type N-terminal cleavage/methylation domain-containing protein/prepilin-type processing-associated H-X9-DG protein
MNRICPFSPRRGFSLVELLVVVGIIALLLGLLMPALNRAKTRADAVRCQTNLHAIYQGLLMYANDHGGWMYPALHRAVENPKETMWPVYVFTPPVWNPPFMICPSDFEPVWEHSYILNNHLHERGIRFGVTKGVDACQIILMGEKKSAEPDYYMNADAGDLADVVEPFRHGFYIGSNYLYLDNHVEAVLPQVMRDQLDPWDPVKVPAGTPGLSGNPTQ